MRRRFVSHKDYTKDRTMKPQVGDLICDKEFPHELGLLLKVGDLRTRQPYLVLCPKGKIGSFGRKYVETECEVVSACR